MAKITTKQVAEPVVEQKPIGIPSRPLFTTVVEEAPAPRTPRALSEKTLAEQAAGVTQLRAYEVPAKSEE